MRTTVIVSFVIFAAVACGGTSGSAEHAGDGDGEGDGDTTAEGQEAEAEGDGDPEADAACCYCYGYGVDAVDGDPANGDNIKDGSFGCDPSYDEESCLAEMEDPSAIEHGQIWGWVENCPQAATDDPYDDSACAMECPEIDPPGQEVWCIQNNDDPQWCGAVWGGCNTTTTNPCADGYDGWAACVHAWSGTCLPDTPGFGGPGCNPSNGWVDACTIDPADWDDVGEDMPTVPAGWCCVCGDALSCVPADECPGIDPGEIFCPVTGNPVEDKLACYSAMCA